MASDFTEKWTAASASQIGRLISAALTAEREACANIAEAVAGTCECGKRISAKIRDRTLADNEVLSNCP